MAYPFATHLSLGLPDCSIQGDDTQDEIPKPGLWPPPEITAADRDDTIVKECGSRWPHYAQERGKKNHPTGLFDYLGALPVLENHLPVQGLPNIEREMLLSSLCGAAPVMIPGMDPSYMPPPPAAFHARCIPASSPASLSAQLTLFYGGTVNVYDNVPADKAQAIMSLAGSSNPWPVKELSSPSMQALNMPGVVTSPFNRFQVPKDRQTQELSSLLVPCQAVVPKALPLARKASLARFLEKRKERIRLMAPYSVKENCQDLPPSMFNNGRLGGHGGEKLGSNCRFLNNDGIAFEMDSEDQNWLTIAENSKQVSECESAT